MKFLKWLCIVSVLIFAGVVMGTLVPRSIGSVDTTSVSRSVLVLSNPIHTDIALPVDEELLSRFGFLRDGNLEIDYPGIRYLVFGWGGREFYTQTPTWADLKPLPLFKGLTLDRSVIHVALAGDIPLSDTSVTALHIPEEGYGKLVDFIHGSFARSQGKPISLPGKSYGTDDVFFEAVGYFNVVAGCNTWTAAALRSAGVKTGWWTPLPQLLVISLRLHNHGTITFDPAALPVP